MIRTLDQVKFDFEALSFVDFDYSRIDASGPERLSRYCDELDAFSNSEAAMSILFETMERLDGCDLGSPGPLVHTLEALPGYERLLKESLLRKPTSLSVWMINRILNGTSKDRTNWLALLRRTLSHPTASTDAKEQAIEFLKHQEQA